MPDPIAKRRARRSTPQSEKRFAEWGWVTVFLITLSAVIGWQNGLNHIELSFFDRLLAVEMRAPNPDIALVAIDAKSIEKLGGWPLSEDIQTRFLARLNAAKPRSVGILTPIDFAKAEASQPVPNPSFAALVAANGHVAINVGPFRSDLDGTTSASSAKIAQAAAASGADRQVPDEDGVMRRVALTSDVRGNVSGVPHFVTAVTEAAGMNLDLPGRRTNEVDGGPSGVGDHWILIPYSGGAGHYPMLSYADVVNGAVPATSLQGKFVLVGRTASQFVSSKRIPALLDARSSRASPLEIDAQLLAGLLEARSIAPLLGSTNALFCAIPVTLAMLALFLWSRRALAVTLVLALLCVLASGAMLRFLNLWFAPGGALIGLALALPLWRWRQLEGDAIRADEILEKTESSSIHYAESTLAAIPLNAGRVERRFMSLSRAIYRVGELRFFIDHIIDSLPQAVLVTNSDGHIVAANRQARNFFASLGNTRLDGAQLPYLLGLMTLEGGEGRSWWDIMDTSVATPQARAHDARNRDLLVRALTWHGINGDLGGWIATIDDVSGIRASERRRNEALRFMTENISMPHRSILELLDSLEGEAIEEELRTAIIEQSRAALSKTEKFIELSNAESRDYAFAVCDVCDAIELAIDGVFSTSEQGFVSVGFDKPSHPVLADIDTLMMSRAIAILLANAIRFSHQGQKVEVAVLEHLDEVVLRVTDYGRGIAPLQQARMMRSLQPLQLVAGANRTESFGLSLSLVRIVTEKHHGRLEFTSNPGQGSEFRIVLPAGKDRATEPPEESAEL